MNSGESTERIRLPVTLHGSDDKEYENENYENYDNEQQIMTIMTLRMWMK